MQYTISTYKGDELIEILCDVELIYDYEETGDIEDFDLTPVIPEDMPLTEAADIIKFAVDWKAGIEALPIGHPTKEEVFDELFEIARLDFIDTQVSQAELLNDRC